MYSTDTHRERGWIQSSRTLSISIIKQLNSSRDKLSDHLQHHKACRTSLLNVLSIKLKKCFPLFEMSFVFNCFWLSMGRWSTFSRMRKGSSHWTFRKWRQVVNHCKWRHSALGKPSSGPLSLLFTSWLYDSGSVKTVIGFFVING